MLIGAVGVVGILVRSNKEVLLVVTCTIGGALPYRKAANAVDDTENK